MAFDFDHDALLDDDFLGRDAVWTPAGGAPVSIRVCLTLGKEEVDLGGDISPLAIEGYAGCKTSVVPGIKAKDTLAADSVTYRVLKVESDETGWTNLMLGKAYS
jgi:nickel-dependent lactate racemase